MRACWYHTVLAGSVLRSTGSGALGWRLSIGIKARGGTNLTYLPRLLSLLTPPTHFPIFETWAFLISSLYDSFGPMSWSFCLSDLIYSLASSPATMSANFLNMRRNIRSDQSSDPSPDVMLSTS